MYGARFRPQGQIPSAIMPKGFRAISDRISQTSAQRRNSRGVEYVIFKISQGGSPTPLVPILYVRR